jgi:septal ring-binding cell division protein DamX
VVPERAVAKAGNWFVVVATYAQKEAAEKRALSMTRSAPRFKAEVYAPALDGKPYYLVVIGSNLSRDAAAALKERARASGFARDAYVTQFSR